MAIYLIVCLVLSQLRNTKADFFHTQSRIVLKPNIKSAKDFGYSISYFNQSLLVGAPHANLNGAVYICPLQIAPGSKSVECSDSGINLNNYANEFDRSLYPTISFCLGTSLAATKSNFVTCAPLWAGKLKEPSSVKGPFGTCFASTEHSYTKTNRLLEHYEKSLESNLSTDAPTTSDVYGTFGWSTLMDEVNKIIVFAKPSSNIRTSRISYLPIGNLTAYPKLVKDIDGDLLKRYNYKGRALTSGAFFKDYNNSVIAFSMENERRMGSVGFLSYNADGDILSVIKDPKTRKTLQFRLDTMGSMFGSALHATDIDHDTYSDLIVGAPGIACWAGSYEVGAVYIYKGGEATTKTNMQPHICGKESGSRFGTAIASADLDDDDIPEIFVSAPYESSGKGTVYVIPGREILERLLIKKENIFIKDLRTQEIKVSQFEAFGFSLNVIPAFDRTQLNALAVGSPYSERVVIYRSIPSITVTVNIVDKQVVRESHDNFTMSVRVGIIYPRSVNVTATLILRVSLVSNMFAEIDGDSEYEWNITDKKPFYLYNVIVKMNNHDLHTYKFKAEVKTKAFKEVYDGSIVRLSSYSKPEIVHDIKRTCDDDVCRPRLSATFKWSGRNDTYVLGSSPEETMSVNVLNDGNSSDYSCAWVQVTGAPVALLKCDQPEDFWYKCDLIVERHEQQSIDIRLNMKRPTSTDHELKVEILLYNNCPMTRVKPDYEAKTTILYKLNPNDIRINGSTSDRIMTESNLNLENETTTDMRSSFTITNEGTLLWKSVKAQLIAASQNSIQHFKAVSSDFQKCDIDPMQNFTYNCILDLKPHCNVRIETTTTLLKSETVDQLLNVGKLITKTSLILIISDHSDPKIKNLMTIFSYQNDKTFGQNETFIIIAAVVGAAIILGLVVYALYRRGFFRREKKKELERIKSIKRPDPTSGTRVQGSERTRASESLPEDNDCTELEVIDDTEDVMMQSLQNVELDTRDETMLIEKGK